MPENIATLPPLARQIHLLRRARGWSQPELATKVDISAAMIGRYERGEMLPPADAMAKLAKVFGVTMDHLYHDTGTPHAQHDKATLDRWATLNQLSSLERDRILSVMDSLMRDARTRNDYGGGQNIKL